MINTLSVEDKLIQTSAPTHLNYILIRLLRSKSMIGHPVRKLCISDERMAYFERNLKIN